MMVVFVGFQPVRRQRNSNVLNEFGVKERESSKFVLIQIHHEQLVGGSKVQFL